MNKILFLALAIAIAAVVGVVGLTVTQEVQAHCNGIGNCNGIQGVAAVAAVMMEEAVMVVMTSLLLIPIFVITFGCAHHVPITACYNNIIRFARQT
jgi:hypothetical protein